MPFELIHFRESDNILKVKHMTQDVQVTLEYISDVLYGTTFRRELFRQAMEEMGWREKDNGNLTILEGRRYSYKGFKKRVAIEGNFSAYEYILEGLFRLQLGFDRGILDVGILLLNGGRSEKTPYESTQKLLLDEMQKLYPTISLPVSIALFDLGIPGEIIKPIGKEATANV